MENMYLNLFAFLLDIQRRQQLGKTIDDIYLEGALIWQMSEDYAAKIWVRNNVTNSADLNPFFPMEIPLPGFGLNFTIRRW